MLTTWKNHLMGVAFLLAVLFIAMPLAVSMAEEDHSSLGMARITYISRDALFNSPDTDEWAALSPNFTLRAGDRLWAGEDSKMEVTFADGGSLRRVPGEELSRPLRITIDCRPGSAMIRDKKR